ncbi:pentatricopeptide repeat-containing protein At2g40720 [Andrographis paniculata]|uniref:pentatricopeptide repeat-containing protein At2g40720 n=1 Tax=Andrographis paniculata TaxID=175694 RepID=UPI0021E875B8|nr:pentatricopeptide repeat-containing protein At2g40720 [Andrographis paniculata]
MHFNGGIFNSTLKQIRFFSSDTKIKTLTQKGNYSEALNSYCNEHKSPISTSRFIFPSLLKACTSPSRSIHGETLHSTLLKLGLHSDPYIVTSLVRMYVGHGSIFSAAKVFDEMPLKISALDVATWNSIIDGYSKHGFFDEGIDRFRRMQAVHVKPDGYTLCILLGMFNGCCSYGKEIHGYVVRNILEDDPFLTAKLIDTYFKSNRIFDARNVFDSSAGSRSIAVWNSMINGLCATGHWRNALDLYVLAKGADLEIGSTTYSCVLTACSQGEAFDFGFRIHCDIVKTGFESDPYVITSLVAFYSKSGLIEDSERIFSCTDERKVEIWNSMISAYVNCDRPEYAYNTYARMRSKGVKTDTFTLSNVLIASSVMGSQKLGEILHAELLKTSLKENVAVQSALLTMYSKLGSFEDARKVFDLIREKDVVAWGSMISASCENGEFDEALSLYKSTEFDGRKPDASIVATVIVACSGLGNGKLGCCVHGFAVKEGLDSDAFVGSSLIEFYSRLRQPEMAKTAFSNVLQKNLVVWNSLISCYSKNGLPELAVSLFSQIQRPDAVSITTVLAAVAQIAGLIKGKALHGYCVRFATMMEDVRVGNSLIDMYVKCGCLVYAERVFRSTTKRDVVTWNSMIAGYGSHGKCDEAIRLFDEMAESGTRPDALTFLAVISACNHGGFLTEGAKLFVSMREYGIEPRTEHYVNVVDMLGRRGRLRDAFRFIEDAAIGDDRGVWLSLLSACRVHRNVEIGEVAARKLVEMEPECGSNYVQAMKMYADAGMEEEAAEVRAAMRRRGLGKAAGCSWIEVKDKVDVFMAGGGCCCRAVEIYEAVERLRNVMEREGEWDFEVEAEAGCL